MSEESREERFKELIKSKEKEKSLPNEILLKIYDVEKEHLRFDQTRSEAIKQIKSIVSSSLPEDIEKLAENKRRARKIANEYDFFVAEAPLMARIGKLLGVILGPRGKMPKPIPPGGDPCPIVRNLKRTVRMRSRDKRTFHVPVGTRDMDPEDIATNIEEIIKRLEHKLERGLQNIESMYVKTTMGPAVKIKLR